jgi:O-methyltransferase involved in polyketide biosynthesis
VVTQLAWIARSLHMDRTVRGFAQRNPEATVVNLGCGLDTTFERVDDGRLTWYDLDFPDVIEMRGKFIQDGDRRHSIACSMLEDSWRRQVGNPRALLLVAAGVLYYLEENEIRAFLIQLADSFPGAEAVFDVCSPLGVRVANQKVIKASGMDESAMLRWGLRRARDLESWDSRIKVLAEHPLFLGMKRGLGLRERWGTWMSDVLRIMSMVHLRLGRLH